MPFGGSDLLLQESVDYLKPEEFQALRRACDLKFEQGPKTEVAAWERDRDKLLFALMWVTGGRVSDVIEMTSDRFNFKEKTITYLVKKRKSKQKRGKKEASEFWHTVSIDMETLAEVMDYIQTWSVQGPLFYVTWRGEKKIMTRQNVNKMINKYSDLIGLRHVYPHMFRHGLAMFLQAQGVTIEAIAYRLAHSSTRITLETYARMNTEQERLGRESIGAKLR